MSKILTFQRTSALINDIDEFFDRCQEAAKLLEKTFLRFFEHGPDDSLQERLNKIRDVERRADELRRAVATSCLRPRLRRWMSLACLPFPRFNSCSCWVDSPSPWVCSIPSL